MADQFPVHEDIAQEREAHFSRARKIFLVVLVGVVLLCAVFLWFTRDAMSHLPFLHSRGQATGSVSTRKQLVDQTPWLTAQALASLAVTSEEARYAREAERLADHDVDQAFAFALREADLQQHALTGHSLALSQRVAQLEQVVSQDQAQVTKLSTGSAAAKQAGDLDVWKAQLSLDSDILADTKKQLARASGDTRDDIQQELKAREATMVKYDSQSGMPTDTALESVQRNGTLAHRIEAWLAQNSRYTAIREAELKTIQDSTALTQHYNQLKVTSSAEENAAASINAAGPNQPGTLSSLKQRAALREILGILYDRIQTEKRLAATYEKWGAQVRLQHRILFHLMLGSVIWLAMILIVMLIADALVRHWTSRPTLDQRRMHTLRAIAEVGIQLVGVCLMLLVIFGVPNQISTVLGLATAGITVALQDFLLAFLGWFVLIGKGGIRIGDLVQIDGVTGEVIEVRLFRTTLLETGDSPDNAHPTGRRVAILNKFAITGQYFNFSTVNQWMWDELTVSVPRSAKTYQVVEKIHEVLREATEADAQQSEREWRQVLKTKSPSHIGSEAQVNLRPAGDGVDLLIRYVTRAANRYDSRNRLYQSILKVLEETAEGATAIGS